MITNCPPASISDEAYDILRLLLQGGVAVKVLSARSQSEDFSGETGEARPLRSGLVSIKRQLFSVYTLQELEAAGLIDDECELTAAGRQYHFFRPSPPSMMRKGRREKPRLEDRIFLGVERNSPVAHAAD